MPSARRIAKSALAALLVAMMLPPLAFAAPETNQISADGASSGIVRLASTASVDDAGDCDASDGSQAVSSGERFEQRSASQAGDLSSVSYVYIEQPVIEVGQAQHLVVGFADEAAFVGELELEVLNTLTGESLAFSASARIEGAAMFELASSALPKGSYAVSSLNCRGDDGSETVFSFANDAAATYSFDVVATAEKESDGGGIVSVYAVGEGGAVSEVDDIAAALAASESARELSSARTLSNGSSPVVIVLDPGHGGSENGASYSGLAEKDLTLAIAQYCKAELETYENVQVYMTRTDDRSVSLRDRADYAVSVGADALVSIHLNADTDPSENGAEVIVPREGSWYYEETHVAGTDLGEKILKQIVALGLSERCVYSRDSDSFTYSDGTLSDYYTIISRARAFGLLAVIVEHAFLSNADDAAFLSIESNLKALGIADATGIAQHFGLYKAGEARYLGVYDYDYYIEQNPDVYAAYGNDRTAAFQHFLAYGMAEGRVASPCFDVSYYRAAYGDLASAFGDDNEQYYYHFTLYGMAEGRQGSGSFSVSSYYNRYPDLREAFRRDLRSYYLHYIGYGRGEGRATAGCGSLVGGTTALDGADYSAVYDPAYYAQGNPDVAAMATFGSAVSLVDDRSLVEHFVWYGMAEGRQGSESFSVSFYRNRYVDLQGAFGSDYALYYIHYIQYGRAEGRQACESDSV